MTAYTSATTGNWNATATWVGNSGFPNAVGDTATWASAAHVITNPVGSTINVGAMSAVGGLTNNGTLTLNGAVSLGVGGAAAAVVLGADSTLNLNGQTITNAGDLTTFVCLGTPGHPVNIRGGPTGNGIITNSGSNRFTPTWDYVDARDMGASVLARSQTTALFPHICNSYFDNCQPNWLDLVSTHVNWGFQCNNNHVTNCPSGASGASYFKIGGNAQALGTQVREFKDNVFDPGGSITSALILDWNDVDGTTVTFTGNVFDRVAMAAVNADLAASDNFFCNVLTTDAVVFHSNGTNWKSNLNNYFYYEGGNHCFQLNASASPWTVSGNIFEQGSTVGGAFAGIGSNWFITPCGTGSTGTISNNIGIQSCGAGTNLGFGNLCVYTTSSSPTLFEIKNNTLFIDNAHQVQQASNPQFYYTPLLDTEQVHSLGGVVNVYNNLVVTSSGFTPDPIVELDTLTANQLNILDFNACWPNAPTYGVYVDGTTTPLGHGANDRRVDPKFYDKARNIKTWDAFLGGPGTAAHAIAELKKRNGVGGTWNPNYTPANAVTYIKRGLTARNSALLGTGYQGGNIGAFVAPPSGNAPDRLRIGVN